MPPISTKTRLYLLIILIVAFFLRAEKINQPYVDIYSLRQCSTAMMAENFYQGHWNILYPQVSWSGPGPSYQGREFQTVTYISALLYTIFGQQDWIGRTVVMIFGLWGIFALFQLVRRLWDEEHALAAAVLMAVTPFSVFMERSFLPDAAMVSLGVTCLWMFISYLQTDKKRYLFLTVITGCLSFLTKIPGMLLGLPMLFAMLTILRRRQQLSASKFVYLTVAGIVMVVPVIAYYLWARHLSLTYPPYHFAGSNNWIWDLGFTYLAKKKFYLKMFILDYIPSLWSIPVFILAAIGVFSFPPQKMYSFKKDENKLLNPAWIFHTYLIGCAVYYLIGADELRWNPWNYHIFTPCICVFAARGLILLSKIKVTKQRTFLVRAAVIVLIIVVNGYFLLRKLYFVDDYMINYRMGLALREARKPGDLVVTVAQDLANPMTIYYSRSKGWVFPPTINNTVPINWWPSKHSVKALNSLISQGAKWFAIARVQYDIINKDYPEFASYIRSYKLHNETSEYLIFELQKADQSNEASF